MSTMEDKLNRVLDHLEGENERLRKALEMAAEGLQSIMDNEDLTMTYLETKMLIDDIKELLK